MINFYFNGIIIGLILAAPVGPIGILCINRSLSRGFRSGFISGLGAASADAVYGAIAAFGLPLITDYLTNSISYIKFLGALLLLYIGMKTLNEIPNNKNQIVSMNRTLAEYLSTLSLTITNPATIFTFIAIYSSFGFTDSKSLTDSIMLVLGIFMGSSIWWALLSYIASRVRNSVETIHFIWINRISGLLIISFAVVVLIKLVYPFIF